MCGGYDTGSSGGGGVRKIWWRDTFKLKFICTVYKFSLQKTQKTQSSLTKTNWLWLLGRKNSTFTVLYRIIILSGFYRWSVHRLFWKAARSAALAAVTIYLESVSACFTSILPFVVVSYLILKKSAEDDFLQIEEARAWFFFFKSSPVLVLLIYIFSFKICCK